MKLISIVAVILCVNIAFGVFVPANDKNIRYEGRFDFTDPQNVKFDWSGVAIVTTFTGDYIAAHISDTGSSEFTVIVDGLPSNVVATNTNTSVYVLAHDLQMQPHSLILVKRTEPVVGTSTFSGFDLSANQTLATPIPAFARRLEVIGDSISCGYGNLGVAPCPFTAATEDWTQTYTGMLASYFDAQHHIEAWSGMGLVRNYADPNPVSKVPLPALLNRTIAADQNSPIWNENNYNPDGVIINLGTNDFSTQPNPDKDVFINAYVALITRIQKAHPHAAVFAVCGPMIGNPCCQYVEQAVIEADEQGLNAHFVNLQGLLTTPADYGCAGHPSVSGHTKMFEKLYPIVEMVLHW